ncbi:MAG: ABC transporter permease [Rhizobiaceae bacterium]|nr:ABC transporter permease [Rhizobiaceae bacterium]
MKQETTPSRRALSWIANYNQVIVLLLLVAASAIFVQGFFSKFNLSSVSYQYAIIGLIALGQFCVVLTRGIDLAQGSVIAVASMVTALTIPHVGIAGALVMGCLAGTMLGMVSGLLVAYTQIAPFVVTLGMMGIARGIALTMTNASPVPVRVAGFAEIARGRLFEIPYPFIVFICLAIVLAVFLRYWRLGRYFYAVGGHEENARLSSVPVKRVKILAYMISGFLAGLAGVIITARIGTGHPLTGINYELESIAAVIVGGASLFGGSGRVIAVVAGVLILGVANSDITLSGISPYLHGTLKGLIILFAVALGQLSFGRRKAA